MKHIRALIVEDEPLARAALRRLMETESDIALVGECADGLAALKAIRQHRPELVFLDVRLPHLSGIDLLKKLDGDMPPAVIFVTAHAGYAVPAFAAHAVDFLLKPFTRERFRESLKRARERLRGKPSLEQGVAALVRPHRDLSPVLKLKVGSHFVFVRADEIDAIVAGRSYSLLQTAGAIHRARISLAELEKKVPPGKFVRINRSTLVNADRVKELAHKGHGDASLRLESGREFSLSRRYRSHWSVLLGSGF